MANKWLLYYWMFNRHLCAIDIVCNRQRMYYYPINYALICVSHASAPTQLSFKLNWKLYFILFNVTNQIWNRPHTFEVLVDHKMTRNSIKIVNFIYELGKECI